MRAAYGAEPSRARIQCSHAQSPLSVARLLRGKVALRRTLRLRRRHVWRVRTMMSVLHGRVPRNLFWMLAMALLFFGLPMSAQGYAEASTDSHAPATRATDDVVQRIREVRDTNPAAAIDMAEPLFKLARGEARFAIGSDRSWSRPISRRNALTMRSR